MAREGTPIPVPDVNFATVDTEDLPTYLAEKLNSFYEYTNYTNRLSLWRRSYEQYYSGYYTVGSIIKKGQLSEKKRIYINHYRNILNHIAVMTTSQRPSFEPRAVNSDYKSQSQVILAKNLLDYYMRQGDLEKHLYDAVNYALMYGEGYLVAEWDPAAGRVVDRTEAEYDDEGEETKAAEDIHEGNLEFYSCGPLDIARDWTKRNNYEHEWYVVRKWVNKWEMAAKYPDFREELESKTYERDQKVINRIEQIEIYNESDLIPVYTFLHKKTAALPEGRQVVFVYDDLVLFDGPLPYDDLPVYRLIPETQKETTWGYSVAFDLLSMQTAMDALESTILTNQITFGVQNITAPKEANIDVSALSVGLNFIQYNGDKAPQALNLVQTPKEIFEYKNDLKTSMEIVSGINSVTRGEPQASLKSGAALALIQSMAIQYNSALQNAYAQLIENVGTGIVNILKMYATSPRIAMITGKVNKPYTREWTANDLELIDRVIVDVGNPMTQTTAGKVNMATELIQNGFIQNVQQYQQVLDTGSLEPLVEGPRAELMNIREENEMLAKGQQPITVMTDNHQLHIQEHKSVVASSVARADQQVTQVTSGHIMEHIMALRTADPDLLALLGQQSLMPMGPQGGGGQPPVSETNQAGQPNMPEQPTNPLTNEQFDTETGGGVV